MVSLALLAAVAPTIVVSGPAPASALAEPERSVTFEVSGSQGGGAEGGNGAVIQATTSLLPGSTVIVVVGGPGYNGGGAATPQLVSGSGAEGGGASDLRIGGDTLAHRVLVAAGGGGAPSGLAGGAGAAIGTGGTGEGFGGSGGSAISGGVGGWCSDATTPGEPGSLGQGGMGGFDDSNRRAGRSGAGGSGGGGWYGGGGGGFCSSAGSGGGGGSSHVDATIFPEGADSAIDGARSGAGRVRVSLDCGATWSTTFDLTGSTQTYTVPSGAADPTVTMVSPSAGPDSGSTVVRITGAELVGATAVRFGTTPAAAFSVDSATQITATTPALPAGPHDVVVETSGCDGVIADGFHSYSVPTVASVSPNTGSTGGGDTVILRGTDLTDVDDVSFGTVAASSFTVDSATQITAVSPAGVAGTVPVKVSNPGNAGIGSVDYTYVTDSTASSNDDPPITNTRVLTGDYAGTSGIDGSVARLYMAAFGRQPDPAGHAYWVERASDGASLPAIAYEFIVGAEFAQRYGELDNAGFVDQLYPNVMGRTGDPDGVAYWNRLLDSGVERVAVTLAFSESAEFRAITGTG